MEVENAEKILTSNGFVKKNAEDFKRNMVEYKEKGFECRQMFHGFDEKTEEYVKEFIGLTNKRYCVIRDEHSIEIALWGWND